MGKVVFFFITALILFYSPAYSEVSDKNAPPARKVEASKLVQKGNASFTAQRYDEAITYYKQAIALDPLSIDAHYDLGVTYGKKGMLDESVAAYTKVIGMNPRHAQAHNNLGAVYEQRGMVNEAHDAYDKAVEADPNLAPAQYNLGKSYISRGSRALAAEHLYKAGSLFLKSRNKEWATKSYNLLKLTDSRELARTLQEQLNQDTSQQKK